MKHTLALLLAAAMALSLSACQKEEPIPPEATTDSSNLPVENPQLNGTTISLSDEEILVNGETISTDEKSAVYKANDIVFYLEGQDFTYGEGTAEDEHSQAEADKHTVVHITQPGNYELSGKLSAGQIAIDLGEDAEEDPNAVVNLYLNNVDISCTVAPGVIFYNVYECGSDDGETATKDVDTSAAGANVYLVDGSTNVVNGSYVARIYKSVELSSDGKTILDSKKLHKYDAAFYSKQSMTINGDSGSLAINAENEGLDSELHLTINGGNISINSGNDGINTNEDGVSVTTVNGGKLHITVNGSTGEGDGIDSNGWLVINGGEVIAYACGFSADSGIDSDMGIHVNGGTVIATGNMVDRLEEGGQNYAIFSFAGTQTGGQAYSLKNEAGEEVLLCNPQNDFSSLIISSPELAEGTYSFWQGDTQLAHGGSGNGGFGFGGGMMGGFGNFGGQMPENMPNMNGQPPQMPQGGSFPQGNMELPEGMNPENFSVNEDGSITLPDGSKLDMENLENFNPEDFNMENFNPENFGNLEGFEGGKQPDFGGQRPNMPFDQESTGAELSTDFVIVKGANSFSGVAVPTETN